MKVLAIKEVVYIGKKEGPDIYSWHSIYKELAQLIGTEATIQVYQEFKGTQVHFPVRLIRPMRYLMFLTMSTTERTYGNWLIIMAIVKDICEES
ncbi:hypothetical protein ABW365_21410 [Enterococcus avium]